MKEFTIGVPYDCGRNKMEYGKPIIDNEFIEKINRYDIIHSLDYYTPTVEACMVHRNVFVCLYENIHHNPQYNRRVTKRIETIIHPNARHFLAASQSVRHSLLNWGVTDDRITVVNFHGCDTNLFRPMHLTHEEKLIYLSEYNIIPTSNNISLFVGRMVFEKGVEYLLESISEIDDISLILVGDGPYVNFIKILPDKVKRKVHHIPHVAHEKLAHIYNIADILILPSIPTPIWIEQLGRVLVEGMACGLPLISTNLGGPVDIIDNNVNGLLINPNSSIEIKNAITSLIYDKDKLYEMGENSYMKCNEKFSNVAVDKIINRCHEIYSV
jgi:glycosyltransferase involved in cell wall biosynthesis